MTLPTCPAVGVLDPASSDRAEAVLVEAGLVDAPGWYARIAADEEFDADLVRVVRDGPVIVGVVHGWTTAFVKDLAVSKSHRGRGVGTALLASIAGEYARRGFASFDLKVEPSNTGAIRLYERLGMVAVGPGEKGR